MTITNIPMNKIPSDPGAVSEHPLTPEELRTALQNLLKQYGSDLRKELGIEVVFPAGAKIGDLDIAGQTVEQVLGLLLKETEHYEPPIVRENVEEKRKHADVPEWLCGHERLIWKGTAERPLWEPQATQYGAVVRVAYKRRDIVLRPGKTAREQSRTLEPITSEFTVQEWTVLKRVLDRYQEAARKLGGPEEVRQDARKQVLELLKEWQKFRHGKGNRPDKFIALVREAIEEVGKQSLDFDATQIDENKLAQAAANMLSQLLVLNRTKGDSSERIPKVKPDIKEIPTFQDALATFVDCAEYQLHEQGKPKGMTLVLGEAGVGKNEMLEYFAARTHRPYFWFPCGRGMEATELVSHYEFDSKEGTIRFLTALAEGVQTPGALVYIDEINALKPEVQAALHGLGDSNRTLTFDGIRIPVAEGVIIVIGGNPATLGSAGDLGEALLNRTRGQSMVINYPALHKGTLRQRKDGWTDAELQQKEAEDNTLRDTACDEVLVLYPIFNEFSGLSDEEFSLLWDTIINEQTQGNRMAAVERNPKLKQLLEGAGGDHIRKVLVDLRTILEVTDEWRRRYEQRGEFRVGMSLRDSIAVTQRYAKFRDVRKAFLSIFDDFRKNPIDGLDSAYVALTQILDEKTAPPFVPTA
ncbi:MAG: AAA family ATPase [Candidatus Peribacteraceae bacterium]|nr:AAA family ATPase [Candidatus Peribacteraceae bacterium]MDD5742141.1 AAA family ATPase [Candidatus Peribacteraceae bacterium]